VKGVEFRTIKIRLASYRKLRAVMERIARSGWVDVGVDSAQPVTVWNAIDAAIDALARQEKKERKKA
jgi:hypothetical protein